MKLLNSEEIDTVSGGISLDPWRCIYPVDPPPAKNQGPSASAEPFAPVKSSGAEGQSVALV